MYPDVLTNIRRPDNGFHPVLVTGVSPVCVFSLIKMKSTLRIIKSTELLSCDTLRYTVIVWLILCKKGLLKLLI